MSEPEETGIDREAWRRRLGDAGAPSELVEMRIRAEARRAPAPPRRSRWTLPASLVAALVIAVLLAQWQVEDERLHPLVDESQIRMQVTPASAPVTVEPAPEEYEYALPAPPPLVDLPAADVARERADQPAMESREAENAAAARQEQGFVPSAAPAPAEAPAEKSTLGEMTATGSRMQKQPADAEASTPLTAVTASDVAGKAKAEQDAGATTRTPEQWYAEIEKLRSAGRDAEADTQLELLEEAYPGWLGHRQEQDAKP